ncbi:MAG: hypothetical protein ACFFFO_18000 [Candidatus Thorarchaeota archaeon]
MANALYDKGREGFLAGDIDWDGNNIKVLLSDDTDYVKNLSTDDYLDDIASAAIEATSGNLTTKAVTAGVADADNVTWSSVSGDECEEVVGYADTGASSTSRLIFNIDTATGLPVTPNGGDIQVTWDDGSNKIFKL